MRAQFIFAAAAAFVLAACGDSTAPVTKSPIAGPLAGRTPSAVFALTSVATGGYNSCGLSGSTAYCWGDNFYGEIGDGSNVSLQPTPSAVTGGISFVSVSPGPAYTCGLSKSGQAYCWGADGFGIDYSVLGRGDSPTDPRLPGPVLGGYSFTSLYTGPYNVCGLTRAGQAYCWGRNTNGQLGTGAAMGASVSQPAPVLPPAGSTTPLSFVTLSIGGAGCGIVKGGAAYCWGNNSSGTLGDGTNTASPTPVPVAGGNTFVAIAVGVAHACGILKSGQAVCWGANSFGQLGDNTTTDSNEPRLVATALTFASVTAGESRTCALTSHGDAYCWGNNDFGELGDGTTTRRHSPTAVAGGFTFTAINAQAFYHTCGMTDRLGAWCWGMNDHGELGIGATSTPVLAPTAVRAP